VFPERKLGRSSTKIARVAAYCHGTGSVVLSNSDISESEACLQLMRDNATGVMRSSTPDEVIHSKKSSISISILKAAGKLQSFSMELDREIENLLNQANQQPSTSTATTVGSITNLQN
jgi:hypothetical protein